MRIKHTVNLIFLGTLLPCLLATPCYSNGKLLATAGTSTVEGSGGGGMVPWATLSGYGTKDETVSSLYSTHINLSDFTMWSYGVAASYHDRVELSASQQTIQGKKNADPISMNTFGAKVRLYGDAIYSQWPQVSVGIQYKNVLDKDAASALGAKKNAGTDVYFSATKIWLDGIFHRNTLLNITLRNTDANQLGLLGFGGDNHHRQWQWESSVAVLINRHWAIGAEYRMKPDNLSAVKEDDWKDIFVAYFPSKQLSITFAYLQLGDVAGQRDQKGPYLSLQGAF